MPIIKLLKAVTAKCGCAGCILAGLALVAICSESLAQEPDMEREIGKLRSSIRENPSQVSELGDIIEKRIHLLSSDQEKGKYLIKAADAFAGVNLRLTARQVLHFTEAGLTFPLATDDLITAYTLQANAIETLNEGTFLQNKQIRRLIAAAELRAVSVIMSNEKIMTLKELPRVTVLTAPIILHNGVPEKTSGWMAAAREQSAKQTAAHYAAIRHNSRVTTCQNILSDLARLYSDSEADQKELNGMAERILKDQDAIHQAVEYMNAHRPKKASANFPLTRSC